jgi:hypothetical protein
MHYGTNMKDKITIPNPLSLWTSMEPATKRWLMGIIGAIIIVAMITGNFDTLISLFIDKAAKK